jgi:hypothetical protein
MLGVVAPGRLGVVAPSVPGVVLPGVLGVVPPAGGVPLPGELDPVPPVPGAGVWAAAVPASMRLVASTATDVLHLIGAPSPLPD